MARLHGVLENMGKRLTKDDEVVVYFPPTGTAPGGTPIFPMWKGKFVRGDDDAFVIERDGTTIVFSWDHIAGLQPAGPPQK